MLRNYLLIALRHLRKRPTYTFINVAGLALGIAVCLLIALFVRDELSYDRFHSKADRIYRAVSRGEQLSTSAALAPALNNDFPEVVHAVRIDRRWPEVLVTHEGESQYEQRFIFTDSTFFEVFYYPLIEGDPRTVLNRPFTVVLTEEMARKYFGDENPVGQTLNLKGLWDAHDFEITGVAENPPHNTHFKFNFLASFDTRYQTEPGAENIGNWGYVGALTYILMDERNDAGALQAKMPEFFVRHEGYRYENRPLPDVPYTFQSVTDIHLYSHLENELEPNSEVRYLYIFSAVALLILLIACINFMNLATARSAHRAREVGVRKVVGAQRRQLVLQFLSESVLMTMAALVLALGILFLSLPAFNRLTGKAMALHILGDGGLWLMLLGMGMLVGVLAGLYPAVFLSGFQPVRVLKGLVSRGASNALFRNGLVVVQFAASVALIIGTLTIQRQLDYMQEKRLGLNPEQVVVIHTRNELGRNYDAFKSELLEHPRILSVSASSPVMPVDSEQLMQLMPTRPEDPEDRKMAHAIPVGTDFLEVMEIPLISGRDFESIDMAPGQSRAHTPVLINQTAARAFGWEAPLGRLLECCYSPTPIVVGVVEDFHFQSLKEEIAPLALMLSGASRFVLARVSTDDLAGTLDFIEDRWQAFAPEYPFEFTFMDDHFEQVYDTEERLAQTFSVFSLLAIVIACLGLFGLATFMSEQRTKEVGIRKVMGASVSSVVALLSKDLIRLVLIAFVLAAPAAYFLIGWWLEDFPYRIGVGPGAFLLAGAAALVVALLAVGTRAVRAALANPVDSLRYE